MWQRTPKQNMGNQGSQSLNSKKQPDQEQVPEQERSYFSVEYLNSNHDLDFTQLENFTNRNFIEASVQNRSGELLDTTQTSEKTQQAPTYETLEHEKSPQKSNLLNTSCRSTQNLVGMVRNGGVLVQRSKSFVRPENRVLPSEWPTKPLKQTNLLKTEGMKRTWRNHNKSNFFKPGTFDTTLQNEIVFDPMMVNKNLLKSQSSFNIVDIQVANANERQVANQRNSCCCITGNVNSAEVSETIHTAFDLSVGKQENRPTKLLSDSRLRINVEKNDVQEVNR